jgi:hypothetical protein
MTANMNNDEFPAEQGFEEVVVPHRNTWCWLHTERLCNGSCEAFDPQGARDQTGTRTGCRLVNGLQSAGKALVTIAKTPIHTNKVPSL